MADIGSWLAIGLVIFAIMYVFLAIQIVRQGYEYTVEHFGRFTRILKPGFHLVWPIFHRIGAKVNL